MTARAVVALDGMGGDRAPEAAVAGALAAARGGIEIALVGDERMLAPCIAAAGGAVAGLRVMHAPDVIQMGEHAALEVRSRRGSSIYVGLELVKRGEAGAFVSCGNTGAVLATALVVLGRLPGVERPALAALLPISGRPTLLLDAGANADYRASHLLQFAHLGSVYMQRMLGIESPTVALLNIGEEQTKGSTERMEAHALLSASPLHFVGNAEGRDVVGASVDVIVTDGFTGNVALKVAEGVVSLMFGELRTAARSSLQARAGGWLLRPALRRVRDRYDYRRYGGAPLLGVNGNVLIGHGASDAAAVESAIRAACRAAEQDVLSALSRAVVDAPTTAAN